jgi:hypothetical protein
VPADAWSVAVPIVRTWGPDGESVALSAGDGAHFALTLSRERALLDAGHASSWARELESSR